MASTLIGWFEAKARDLPWRRTRDPYAIWVSEVMLQQTQVATVVNYWERWMSQLPDVRALAQAPLEVVLKLWEGLGYYRRARQLHAAARRIIEQHDGQLPQRGAEWLQLPGIGPYTAGAIASIAFNEPAPLVDGNVVRVIARLERLPGLSTSSRLKARVWARAESLVRAASRLTAKTEHRFPACSAFNQALMELGATVCTPRNPRCPDCPLADLCEARRLGLQASLPVPGKRPATVHQRRAVVMIEINGRFLVQQRPAGDRNEGLWEFPQHPCSGHTRGHATEAATAWGLDPACLEPKGILRHTITRHRLTLELFYARPGRWSGRIPGRWATRSEMHEMAFSGAHRRMIRQFLPQGLPHPE